MNVGVQTEEGVTVQGNEVTVKAGTPVVFNISGDPDNISFWSGEEGSAYANKEPYCSRRKRSRVVNTPLQNMGTLWKWRLHKGCSTYVYVGKLPWYCRQRL